jgi:GT2 family glycosyltransferase
MGTLDPPPDFGPLPEAPNPVGYVDLAFSAGCHSLCVTGWLAAIHPQVERVSLVNEHGMAVSVPYRFQRMERPDVAAAIQSKLPDGYIVTGYCLLVETSGVSRPVMLRLGLVDGTCFAADMTEDVLMRGAEANQPYLLQLVRPLWEEPPRCSVIIPAHNQAALVGQCLNTLFAASSGKVTFEIIAVDDGSTDMTPRALTGFGTRIRLLRHPSKTGLASACNDGALLARGEYLVFLSSDKVPQPGWLDALVQYADDHAQAGTVGSKLLFANNTVQHAGMVICQDGYARPVYAGLPAHHPAVTKSRRFQAVTGACMLCRRTLFEELQGFDPAFINGSQDVDFCLRLGERGHEVHYCHTSVVYHAESSPRTDDPALEKEVDHNDRVYRRRWLPRVKPDELQFYSEDGLLTLVHTDLYPLRLHVSPLVAVADGGGEDDAGGQLDIMARRNEELLKENGRLRVQVMEAQLQAPSDSLGASPALAGGAVGGSRDRPLTTFITPTYNKPGFFREAAQSILKQTSDAWRWWVILDGADQETTDIAHDLAKQDSRIVLFTEEVASRYDQYRPAVLANKYFPLISTKYFCWHSDDDVKEPCFLETLVSELEAHPDFHVAYGICHAYVQEGDEWVLRVSLPQDPSWRFGPDSPVTPDCKLDAGQFLQTKASWDKVNWKVPTRYGATTHVDGIYLNQLARRFPFLFVNVHVQTCRHTYLSENLRGGRTKQPGSSPENPKGRQADPDAPSALSSHWEQALGDINRLVMGSRHLFVEGWLAAASPRVEQVLLGNGQGRPAAVPFKVRFSERPEVLAEMKPHIPAGHVCTGFMLLIDSAGKGAPDLLRLDLGGGASSTVRLAEQAFSPMTETFERDLLHIFGKGCACAACRRMTRKSR